jgi:hypothetical protein
MSESIQDIREFVLHQAKQNIEFVKQSPGNVAQAKQVNSSLSAIVAMERNIVMHKALERARKNETVPTLPES